MTTYKHDECATYSVHFEQAQHRDKDSSIKVSAALAVYCRHIDSCFLLSTRAIRDWKCMMECLQEKMRTTQKQLDDLTRQVSSLLSEKSQLETRTRILEQVVYLNTNHEQRLHANQAGCRLMGGLCPVVTLQLSCSRRSAT